MKLRTSHAGLLLLFLILFLNACQPEIDGPPGGNNNPVVTPKAVTASVQGKVVDENNAPVQGAIVKSGTNSTTTDNRGIFQFKNIQLDKYASVVTVEKAGYFKGIRTFSSKEGASNYIRLKLIRKIQIGTIDASAGGFVDLPDNSRITIGANSIVLRANNQPYSGTVRVFAAMIDPTSGDMQQLIPGSFQASDAQNRRFILKSYGMIAVELEGQASEPLRIATGKTAKLRMTIPASLQASAPASIPLWFLNETDGLWKEEGSATKTGNYYEGDVNHFSFWNCDISMPTIFLELSVHTSDGPLPNTLVRITRTNTSAFSYGVTDSLGYVGGLVPSNEPLLLEILNSCNQMVYSQNIGPFAQNANLGTITIAIPTQYNLTVSGSVLNCSNQPVTNGTVFIYFEGQLYSPAVTNGNFEATITRCSNSSATVEITAVDNATSQQSNLYTGSASTGSVSAGNLVACGTSSATFIDYTLDAVNYSINTNNTGDSIQAFDSTGYTYISAYSGSQSTVSITFGFNGASTGSFPMGWLYVNQYNQTTIVSPLNVVITAYGNPGQFIDGNFSGQFRDQANNLHNISGNFKVRRL